MRTCYLIEPEDMARLRSVAQAMGTPYAMPKRDATRHLGQILSRAIEIELPDAAPDGPTQCRTVTAVTVAAAGTWIGGQNAPYDPNDKITVSEDQR